jgi:hypothetical protein
MGWTTTHKPKGISATDYLLHHSGALSWGPDNPATYKVLDTAIVNLKTFYAAVERIDKQTKAREVWAAIFLLGYWRGEENFGWKSMSEEMGPCEAECPERILDLLTETDNENALDWRKRCREFHARRKARPKIVPQSRIVYGGRRYLVLERYGKSAWRIQDENTRQVYKLTDMRARQVTEVIAPTTKGG